MTDPNHVDIDADLAGRVNLALREIVLLLRRVSADAVVSSPQLSVLGSLETGPVRMSDLAAEHGVRLPTMTAQVNRLERDGLARRHRDNRDARVVTVTLTPAGRAALHAGRTTRIGFLTERLERLSPDDRRAIAAALPALSRLSKGDTSP